MPMYPPKLPAVSPTITHWISLAAVTVIGAALGYLQSDPTLATDVFDPVKLKGLILGALAGAGTALVLLVQRSLLPSVTASAHEENLDVASVKQLAAISATAIANDKLRVERQSAETPIDTSVPKIPKANPSQFPKGS